MGQSDAVGFGGYSALVIALITSLAGNIRYTLPVLSHSDVVDDCGSCIGEVAALRADIRVTLYLEIFISLSLVALVVFCVWFRRPRTAAAAGSADKSVGCSGTARLPVRSVSEVLAEAKPPDFQLSQADLNVHRRGSRR
jgi:hypothetical protein